MHALAGASSVHSVVRVTGNFASEGPLHPAAREALLAAFDQGWADPKKLSQSSSRAAILQNQALENIATRLGLPVSSIEVLGEPALGHYLSITGLASDSSALAYSAIDKGKVRAVARAHSAQVVELPVNKSGAIQNFSSVPQVYMNNNNLLISFNFSLKLKKIEFMAIRKIESCSYCCTRYGQSCLFI